MRVRIHPLVPQMVIGIFIIFAIRWATHGLHNAFATLLFMAGGLVSLIPGAALLVYVTKRRAIASESEKRRWLLAYVPVVVVAGAVPGAVIGLVYQQLYGAPPGLRDPDPVLYTFSHMILAGLALSIGSGCAVFVSTLPARTRVGRALRFLGAILIAIIMSGIFVGLIWRFIQK